MFLGSQITKSSVYKNEITEAAVSAIQETIDKISAGLLPLEVDNADPATLGMLRPTMPEEDRAVDLTLDAQAGRLDVHVPAAELAARAVAAPDLSANGHGTGRELFANFRRVAGGADEGAAVF